MIILDEEETQLPKIASPAPVHPVVRRPGTPTPSLPDYETSQEQEEQKLYKRKPMSKRLRYSIYGLIAYFVVTIAIGVPLIVVKTRHDEGNYKSPSMLYPTPPPWGLNGTGLPGFNLGEAPICVDAATACDQWSVQDQLVDGLDGILQARLQYYVPVSNTVFVQSNVSCLPSKAGPITGSLSVGINTDPTAKQIAVKVKMSYSGTDIRERTSVCLMNLGNSDGLYLYVPSNLTSADHLDFNVSMLFPKTTNASRPLYVQNFLTSLPFFSQYVGSVSPRVIFGYVALEGMQSNVTIDNIALSLGHRICLHH